MKTPSKRKVIKKAPSKKTSSKKPSSRKTSSKRPAAGFRGIVKVQPIVVQGLLAGKPTGGAIAPGFKPQRQLNLKFMGGRTIPNLSFRSFYLGGANWSDSDVQNIDKALSGAMADPDLNNVMLQYFPGSNSISTRFLGSQKLQGAVPPTFTRDSVNPTIQALLTNGTLNGTNFDNTVICLFLPPGVVLTDAAAGGVGKLKLKGDDDDKASSKAGLGGYHGSCHIGATRVYFAVGVYSQFIGRTPNGIPIWPDSWKNIVATFYHELNEARTDPDVEESERANNQRLLGWYANVRDGGEIGDIPMNEAGSRLHLVMVEVPLANGDTAPIQLMWSNTVGGPQGPFT